VTRHSITWQSKAVTEFSFDDEAIDQQQGKRGVEEEGDVGQDLVVEPDQVGIERKQGHQEQA